MRTLLIALTTFLHACALAPSEVPEKTLSREDYLGIVEAVAAEMLVAQDGIDVIILSIDGFELELPSRLLGKECRPWTTDDDVLRSMTKSLQKSQKLVGLKVRLLKNEDPIVHVESSVTRIGLRLSGTWTLRRTQDSWAIENLVSADWMD